MLVGTADVDRLAARAPKLERLDAGPATLEGVLILQVLAEIRSHVLQDLLPPGLHPTLPPLARWTAYKVGSSPWGAFQLATLNIECRSGTRPRAFLCGGYVNNREAGAALSGGWGYGIEPGRVNLQRGYHEIRLDVERNGKSILALALEDPERLAPTDLQFFATMHLAHTERGLRLLQVDPTHEIELAERGDPQIEGFEAGAWGDDRIEPIYPVSASFAVGKLTLPKLRFMCRPDVLAFEGTERV